MPLVAHREVVTPRTLAEAVEFLGGHAGEGWRPVAGGTDVMVAIDHGKEPCARWLDLSRLRDEIGGIETRGDILRLGGLATMTDLRRSSACRDACPMIGEAAATIGAVQIQNRATVAGNIVNASPAGDTLPVWLALDAEVELTGPHGPRRVPYRDFHTGYRATALHADELLTAVLVPALPSDARVLFRKVGTRAAQAISKVVLAAVSRLGEDGKFAEVRLAFGSMAPVPCRARHAERAANGAPATAATARAAAAQLKRDLAPIDDVRSSAAYRMAVAEGLVREFLAGELGARPAGR